MVGDISLREHDRSVHAASFSIGCTRKAPVDAATRDKDWEAYGELLLTGEEPLHELERCTQCIREFVSKHTKQALFEAARRRGLLIVPVATTQDVVHSEQLAARAFWTELYQPAVGRPIAYPGPFARFSRTPITYRRAAPRIDEHNGEVLRDLTQPAPAAPPPPRPFSLPLAGINVVDLSWVIATPFGVRYLADWGATVIHVESTTRPDPLRGLGPFLERRAGCRSVRAVRQHAGQQAGPESEPRH